ncbi:MAG: hypothetical protein FJW32_19105 [Acidobacteria bacterium]|nr:hypothetical protein [Acidobacteriota bacterium]
MQRLVLAVVTAAALSAQVSLSELNFCPTPTGRPARVSAPDFYPSHVPRGTDLVKVTLNAPEAVCNDGSPAIMYVRRAAAGARDSMGPVDNKWIIHNQEGGACNDYAQCLERWCGTGFYDASKMSSKYAPATMGGAGIFSRTASNEFGNYNQVYVYYCSSDLWIGRKTDSVLSDGNRSFKAQFKGARIIDAVFDALRTGLNDAQGRPLLPPLDNATHVYYTGSSAGSAGTRMNADRVGAIFRARMPNAVYAALTDAGINGNSDGVSLLAIGDPNDPYTVQQTAMHAKMTQAWDAQYDASCLQLNATRPWICSDSVFVTQNHVTTPIFNRTDLLDSNKIKDFETTTLYKTRAEFARASHDEMTQFTRMRELSPERAQMTKSPGAYAPNCGVHITLDSNTFFSKHVTLNGTRLSFYDVLWNWVSANGGPTIALTAKPPATPADPPYDAECSSAAPATPALVTVNSASFDRTQPIAPDSIASVFGTNLAPELRAAATVPLPLDLLGTTVGVRDRNGVRRGARLIAVSPGQINFIVPAGLAAGTATIGAQNGGDETFLATVELAAVAPGLYSANAQGRGVAAAVWLAVSASGVRTSGLLFDPATLAPAPVDLSGGDVYLTLFGTGLRGASAVQATIGGTGVPVLGFAAQPEFAGLDQVNLGPIPRSLAGRANAEISLTANGVRANAVTVSFR